MIVSSILVNFKKIDTKISIRVEGIVTEMKKLETFVDSPIINIYNNGGRQFLSEFL